MCEIEQWKRQANTIKIVKRMREKETETKSEKEWETEKER